MRKGLFWLNDKQLIESHLPTNQTGPAREDDRRTICGIIHMLQCGARWRDCPPDYRALGLPRTKYMMALSAISTIKWRIDVKWQIML